MGNSSGLCYRYCASLEHSCGHFWNGKRKRCSLQEALAVNDLFDFRPAGLIADLGLLTPGMDYRETAAYGHFGRSQFPWEKTDKTEALRALVS